MEGGERESEAEGKKATFKSDKPFMLFRTRMSHGKAHTFTTSLKREEKWSLN